MLLLSVDSYTVQYGLIDSKFYKNSYSFLEEFGTRVNSAQSMLLEKTLIWECKAMPAGIVSACDSLCTSWVIDTSHLKVNAKALYHATADLWPQGEVMMTVPIVGVTAFQSCPFPCLFSTASLSPSLPFSCRSFPLRACTIRV